MRKVFTSVLMLLCLISFGQNSQIDELWKLYSSGDLDSVIDKAKPLLDNEPGNVDLNLMIGRSNADLGRYKNAIPYLEAAVLNDTYNSWQKAWALVYLGNSHFMSEKYEDSEKSLNACISLNATKNATNEAYKSSLLFGFNSFHNSWKTVETKNFRFHFQNMSDSDIENYISSREMAFMNINEFFGSKLPKKIDFFVWNSRDDARKILNADLGFANPGYCIIHSHFQQSKGHEMTHIISHYTGISEKKTGLINEGTAVCFDLTRQDREQMVKDWIKTNGKKITISEVWTNWNAYPKELTYPLSGLFVKAVIDNFGKDKFLQFFDDQTYENAKLVFGDKLDEVIHEFENKINT